MCSTGRSEGDLPEFGAELAAVSLLGAGEGENVDDWAHFLHRLAGLDPTPERGSERERRMNR